MNNRFYDNLCNQCRWDCKSKCEVAQCETFGKKIHYNEEELSQLNIEDLTRLEELIQSHPKNYTYEEYLRMHHFLYEVELIKDVRRAMSGEK